MRSGLWKSRSLVPSTNTKYSEKKVENEDLVSKVRRNDTTLYWQLARRQALTTW